MRKWKFWAVAAGVFLAAFIAISLLSFDSRDGDYYPKSPEAYNYCGKVGSWLSLWLYKWFGVISYLLPCSILLLIFLFAYKKHLLSNWSSWVWSGCVIGWSCIFAAYLQQGPLNSSCMPSYGGLFGLYWLEFLRRFLGERAAAAIVVCATLLLMFWGFFVQIEYNIGKGKNSNTKAEKKNFG